MYKVLILLVLIGGLILFLDYKSISLTSPQEELTQLEYKELSDKSKADTLVIVEKKIYSS